VNWELVTVLSTFETIPHVERLDYIRAHRTELMGHVLIGVLSTGIYCLPICTARQPKPENVRFFETEPEAQAAGLRPCMRCRPDYFYRNYDPDLEQLTGLVESLHKDPAAYSAGLDSMVEASGIGSTKLHALFRQHYHTTPAAYLNRVRLAAACELLSDPARQVIDIAYAVGYESLSAFHDNFRKATGMTPGDYQRLGQTDCFTVMLPENYLSWVTLKLLARDPQSPMEQVNGKHAVKALQVGSNGVLVHMDWHESEQGGYVQCRVESSVPLDTHGMQAVHNVVIRLFGLATNPTGFERLITVDPNLASLIKGREGLRIPQYGELFEGITWAIVGQQVSIPVAAKLRRQLAALCGQRINDQFIAHPTAEAVAKLDYDDLVKCQFSRRKAEYLIDLARLMTSGELTFDSRESATEIETRLMNIRGLGKWSVNYIMMRVLGFADCAPLGDTGLSSGLQRFFNLDHRPDADETARLMKTFEPYRSLATYHLWMS
jgi:AraC family transcriptional regulator, regulatory protein of adaptative response / DNA-3-methyladenine glycosylase II